MKIGFVENLYGTPKGHSYVVRDMVSAVMGKKHETHMYRIGLDNKLGPEFTKPTTMKTYPDKTIPKDAFEKWLDEIKPEICIFMEYLQWWNDDYDKLDICKERGIKTIGFLVYEKLDWDKLEHYKKYTNIISPTRFQTKVLRSKGLYNVVYTPWGTNKKEIDEIPYPPRTKKTIFYHCAGSGGVGDRKNTDAIIKAYKKIEDDTTKLIITHLNSKTFSRKEIISFMKYADVLINTSRWDTIGLNTVEMNMCGRPTIVSDTGPMNEIVKKNVNGLCVDGENIDIDVVTCQSFEIDVDSLANQMTILKNKEILKMMKKNSRKYATKHFDWEKNKKHFLKLIEKR